MILFDELQKSIHKKNNGAIDALMFIAKIESIRNKQFNYQDFKNKVGNYYTASTREHFEIYKEEGLTKFYQLDESKLSDGEFYLDIIEKQISKIELSVTSPKYKTSYVKMLMKYSDFIGTPSKNAEKFMKHEKIVLSLIIINALLFLTILAGTVWVRNSYQSGGTPEEVLTYIMTFLGFPGISALLIASFIHLTSIKKQYSKPVLIILLVGFMIFAAPFFPALSNPEDYTYNKTIVVKSIDILKENGNIKTLKIDEISGNETTIYAHKSLNLQVGKTYSVKGYKTINIVVIADEIANDTSEKTAGK